MLADWLAILHKKPAGTPLPWQRNEETFVLNGHPERPGSKFKPEWIYSYRPPLSERWRIRGGHSPCGDIEILEPRREIAHIGFCHEARFKHGIKGCGEGAYPGARCGIECVRSDRPPPDASAHLNVGAMDVRSGKTQVWQHQILNAAPHLGLALPAIAAASANVTILHSGIFREGANYVIDAAALTAPERFGTFGATVTIAEPWKEPPDVVENFVYAFAGFGEGVHNNYPQVAYWPFRGVRGWEAPADDDRSAYGDAHLWPTCGARGWVAYLTRPVGTEGRSRMRNLANEEEAVEALREALDDLGYSLRVVSSPRHAVWFATAAGLVGVHGGAFANMHALKPGAKVLEIIGEEAPTTLRPRWSYASLAHGLKLDYRAYYPDVWPGYDPPEYVGAEGVLVNATHFAAFAREVFSSECE